ncbi:MAG: potassium transporter TrkG, partial [Candidatus Cloacimonetes bacterium]|nr:potassium transporter TrkG [Candidatus Cloacimonadota bacterium]
MPKSISSAPLRHIELIAYLLAGWSFIVLFLEAIISFYLNYPVVLFITAGANILVLVFTILNRILLGELKKSKYIIVFDLLMLLIGVLLLKNQAKFVVFFLLIRQTYFVLNFVIFHAFEGRFYKLLSTNPPVSLMLSFAGVILIGTILLMLPASSTSGQVTHFINALFTSTSATCVTGLVVFDTGSYFSTFGQFVIMLLIQIGGLGIMTISTAFAIILGQRLTLKLSNVLQKVVGETQAIDVFSLLRSIVLVTFIIEFIGAILLYTQFVKVLSPTDAMYNSIFHSVSAFCNAGFALWSDSMMSFAFNPVVNLSITLLIIFGGLGFTVLIEVFRYLFWQGKVKKLTL